MEPNLTDAQFFHLKTVCNKAVGSGPEMVKHIEDLYVAVHSLAVKEDNDTSIPIMEPVVALLNHYGEVFTLLVPFCRELGMG